MNKKIYLNLLIVDFLKFLIPTTDNQTMVINDEKILNFNWGHRYHLLTSSSMPILIALTLFFFIFSLISNFHLIFENNLALISNFLSYYISTGLISNFWNFKFCSSELSIDFFFNPEFLSIDFFFITWLKSFLFVLAVMFYWFGFAVFESIFLQITEITIYKWNKFIMLENRFHTTIVRRGFKLGFFLFIISEIFFFFGFFWAFFHSSLSPSIQIGGVWPPINIEFLPIDGFAITNTVVLLSSGVTITLAHHFIMLNNKIIFKFVKLFLFKKRIIIFLFLTLILALIFLICQFFEYCSLSISINSGIYGSTFFMITGLHGIHVFIGFCFLTYCLLPITPIKFKNCFINLFKVFLNLEIINFNQLNWINIKTENWNYGSKGIESFECAAWYWHFVDVVWLFVFGFIYIWSHIGIL